MANDKKEKPKFVVKPKRLGTPLGFSSGKFIQTLHPTDEEAAQILEKYPAEKIFSVFPIELKGKKLENFINENHPRIIKEREEAEAKVKKETGKNKSNDNGKEVKKSKKEQVGEKKLPDNSQDNDNSNSKSE